MPRSSYRHAAVAAAAVCTLLAGALVAPATPASGAVNTCPAVSSSVVRSAPGSGKTVALTFDDGPGPETPKVLEILRKYNVRATFFEIGNQANIWPGYAHQVVAEGHLLGNHSYSHRDFTKLSSAAQRSQLDWATDALIDATGTRPCWFRPPYGANNARTIASAVSRHLRPAVWNVDTNDWSAAGTPNAADKAMILRNAKAGGKLKHPLILMHDGGSHHRPNMLAELETIIRYYRDCGYRFVDLAGHSGLKPLPANRIDYRRSPQGRVVKYAVGPGKITATGWAVDHDAPKTPVTIRAQLDGRWVTTTTLANRNLATVPSTTTPIDFTLTITAPRGHHVVCSFAVNIGAGATGGLGCAGVQVT